MASFEFGRKQFGRPTPANIGFTITLFSGIAGIVQTWMGTASYIPNGVSNVLISILGLLIAIANFLRPFFGVPIDTKTVPSEQVTEIELKPKDK